MPKIKDLGITVVPEQFRPPEIGGAGCGVTSCTDCTTQAFSICGTTRQPIAGCSDCTSDPMSNCGVQSYIACTDCTTEAFSICGTTWCRDCTTQPFSLCGTTRIKGGVACRLQSRFPTVLELTTPCGGSFVGPGTLRQRGGGLRLEDIAVLREQLNEQLKALDELEKSLGPQSIEEVEAREKQLNDELSKLKSIRTQLGKKK